RLCGTTKEPGTGKQCPAGRIKVEQETEFGEPGVLIDTIKGLGGKRVHCKNVAVNTGALRCATAIETSATAIIQQGRRPARNEGALGFASIPCQACDSARDIGHTPVPKSTSRWCIRIEAAHNKTLSTCRKPGPVEFWGHVLSTGSLAILCC